MHTGQYSFKIANGGSTDKIVCILPSIFGTESISNAITLGSSSGEVYATSITSTFSRTDESRIDDRYSAIDHVLDDGTFATNFTGTALNTKFRIREFQRWLWLNPLVLKKMTITADDDEVFDDSLFISQYSPLRETEVEEVPLSKYQDTYQQISTKIVMDELNWVLNGNTVWYMQIQDSRTVTFKLFF